MRPVAPDILIRPLQGDDVAAVQALLNPILATTVYSREMTIEMVQSQVLRPSPSTIFPVRWQQNRCLGAWRGGHLIGFIDVGIGFDSDSLDEPDYRPLGILRFLALAQEDDAAEGAGFVTAQLREEAAGRLLQAADLFWQESGIRTVKAFHPSTGYPALQGGVGVLPGDWAIHFRQLTGRDYRLTERYYCLQRPLSTPLEEFVSQADLSLAFRGRMDDRIYELYRRTDRLGRARLVRLTTRRDDQTHPFGLIADLVIDPIWRRHDLGRLLVTRMINDGGLQALRELVVFVAMHQYAAASLFAQQGFQELNYRGYSFERVLAH